VVGEEKSDPSLEDKSDPEIEEYLFPQAFPKGYARGLLFGSQYYELGGTTLVECERTGLVCELEFKLAKLLGGGRSRVRGVIKDKATGEELVVVTGEWDNVITAEAKTEEAAQAVKNVCTGKNVLYERSQILPSDFTQLQVIHDTRQGELSTSVDVWSKGCGCITKGDYIQADIEKFQVESNQRAYIKELNRTETPHPLKFFHLEPNLGFVLNDDHDAFAISSKSAGR